MSKSDFLEAGFLNYYWGAVALTQPTNHYIGLYTTATDDAGGGTEVTGNGYARVAVLNNATQWPAATGTSPTTKTHANDITFPTASGGNWGTITHFALSDAATSGNRSVHGALTASKSVEDGDTARFAAGALTITED